MQIESSIMYSQSAMRLLTRNPAMSLNVPLVFRLVSVRRNDSLSLTQRGFSLMMVMVVLIGTAIFSLSSSQIGLISERSSRNDRDKEIAFQSAEEALIDAEADIMVYRKSFFDGTDNPQEFVENCGSSGLCAMTLPNKKPAWLIVDFPPSTSTNTTKFGTYTGRTFHTGIGIQPALPPYYIIELVPYPIGDKSKPVYMYQVTAMGYGTRSDTQVVLQMLYLN